MATQILTIPDIGDYTDVPVLDVYIKAGQRIELETPLLSLESAKAVTDIPSTSAGTVTKLLVSEGDLVSAGTPIAEIETAEAEVVPKKQEAETAASAVAPSPLLTAYHATPSVRQYAREQGIDLSQVVPTGPHGRIRREDLEPVQTKREEPASESERIPLSRIQRLSGPHLTDSWQRIPHVTQFDEADVTDLESFRKELRSEYTGPGKLSLLPFIIRAVTAALQQHPLFNAELDEESNEILLKRQFHIGIAVDTPEGLVVPVIHDAEKKSLFTLAEELFELSERARAGKLRPADITGGTFSISSLGGISGTGFTPIINAPQTAILGIARMKKSPIWDGETFKPGDTLPFSVSYDHRVIDGAEGARFTRDLSRYLHDIRRVLL